MTRTWDLDDEALDTFPLDAGTGPGRVRVVDEETSTFLDGEDLLALLAETDGLAMDFVAPRPVGAAEEQRGSALSRDGAEGHNPALNRQVQADVDWAALTSGPEGSGPVPTPAPDEEATLHDDFVDSPHAPVVTSRRRRLVVEGGRRVATLDELAQAAGLRGPAGKELPFRRDVVLETQAEAWDVDADQADALLRSEGPRSDASAGQAVIEAPATVAKVDLGARPGVADAPEPSDPEMDVNDEPYDEDMDEPVTVLNTGDEWRLPSPPAAPDFVLDDEPEDDDGAMEDDAEVFAMPDDEPAFSVEDTSSFEAVPAPAERRKGWADGLRPTVRGGDGQPIAPLEEAEESVPVWDARSEPGTGPGVGKKHIGSWQPGQKAAPARKGRGAVQAEPMSPIAAAAYGLGLASVVGGLAVVAWFYLT